MIKRNFSTLILSLTAVLVISLPSCDPGKRMEREERNEIQDYLGKNSSVHFELQPSGLYYHEVLAGTGNSPVRGDSAFVRYTGKFLDGTIFDSNLTLAKPYGFIIGTNIAGFDEGVSLMKVGGKATLVIPSSIGYGTIGSPPYISGYTPLLFELELIKTVAAAGK